MGEADGGWASVLDGAAEGDRPATLKLLRRVAELAERYGAFTLEDDWGEAAAAWTREITAQWRRRRGTRDAGTVIEFTVKNGFWGLVLERLRQSDAYAYALLERTLHRLLASQWDRARKYEEHWEDLVQQSIVELWKLAERGELEHPWSLVRTVGKRRYVDVHRRVSRVPEMVSDEEPTAPDDDGFDGRLLLSELLDWLTDDERRCIEMIDVRGMTRREAAGALGVSEGVVGATRRAGLRTLFRQLGEGLPPGLHRVWERTIIGGERPSPARVAAELGLEEATVVARYRQARELIGV